MQTKKERLRQILLQNSYEKREVKLSSGGTSDFYFDGKQTSLHPEGSALIGELLLDLIHTSGRKVEAVGGPTLGADPLVTAISLSSFQKGVPIPAFIVRKEPKKHGTAAWIEGGKNLRPGQCVALVEDVITTGGSLLKAVEKVERAGFFVTLLLTLVDREEGGKERIETQGYRLLSLFSKKDLLE